MFDVAIWGTVAEWVTGFLTLTAICVALYLGVRKPSETITYGAYLVVQSETGPLIRLVVNNTEMAADVWLINATLWEENIGVGSISDVAWPIRIRAGQSVPLLFPLMKIGPGTENIFVDFVTGRGKRYYAHPSKQTLEDIKAVRRAFITHGPRASNDQTH